jgi:hypothetical protein
MKVEQTRSKTWVLFVIFGVVFGVFMVYKALYPIYLKSQVPVLDAAWVVSKTGGEAAATTDPKFIVEGDDITLYAVARGGKKGSKDTYYFTEAPALVIDGEAVPADRIRPWQPSWGDIRVFWYKVEPEGSAFPEIASLEEIPYRHSFCTGWGSTWSHSVDVTPDYKPYHKDNVGTMRYKVKFVLYWGDNQVNPFRKADSPGLETVTGAGIGSAVHRVTVAGTDPDTGIYRAFFNLPYLKEPWPSPSAADHPAARFIAAGCRDFIIAARRLAGEEGLAFTPEGGLDRYGRRIFTDLQLYADRSYREKRAPGRKIPFGPGGVLPGDLLVLGDMAGVIVRDEGGMRVGADILSDDDIMITNYMDYPGESRIGDVFEDGFAVLRWRGAEGWENSDR